MKLLKSIIAVALATMVLASCTDERKTAQYNAETQGEKITSALTEAALLLNPDFYYDSIESVKWLMNYCLHEHVVDLTPVEEKVAGIIDSWTTSTETESEKIVRAIYEFSEMTGRFVFSVDEDGKPSWSVENANNLQIKWIDKDGISAELIINVRDSSKKFLMFSHEGEISQQTYLVLPRSISAKLIKGGRTLSTANINASYKIANEDKVSSTDHINFSADIDIEDYKINFTRCALSTSDSKAAVKIMRNNELILKGNGTIKGMEFSDETGSFTKLGKAQFTLDVRGKVQVAAKLDLQAIADCNARENQASEDRAAAEVYEAIVNDFNKAVDVVFYFDGFKTPQSYVVYEYDKEYDYISSGVFTYDGEQVMPEMHRVSGAVNLFLNAFYEIGEFYCPDCEVI